MRFDKLTINAAEALQEAERLAQEAGHSEVTPPHLLASLVTPRAPGGNGDGGIVRPLLAKDGYDPVFGARPLKRLIQQEIENPLAKRILSGEFSAGETIAVDVRGESFSFETDGRVERAARDR